MFANTFPSAHIISSARNVPKKLLHQVYGAAKIKDHPEKIEIPKNFKWNTHVFYHKPLPRGTSGEPLYFVLAVLFYNQPCRVATLWNICRQIPFVPLDSRRHLREVVHQARREEWIYFDKTDCWYIYPTRERYEELKTVVSKWRETWLSRHNERTPDISPNKQEVSQFVAQLGEKEKGRHQEQIEGQLGQMEHKLRKYERTQIEYLPYTDPNGKVNFMWWYDTSGKGEPIDEVCGLERSGGNHRTLNSHAPFEAERRTDV